MPQAYQRINAGGCIICTTLAVVAGTIIKTYVIKRQEGGDCKLVHLLI